VYQTRGFISKLGIGREKVDEVDGVDEPETTEMLRRAQHDNRGQGAWPVVMYR
jgi:hypothetical protein